MVGITSYGAYIPMHRLARAEFAKAWGGRAAPGEKAVANFDEDSLTIAVEAGLDCLKGMDRSTVDALFFATTTSPYREKQGAATAAMALDLRHDIRTTDITDSLRAATTAMSLAADAIKAGSARNVLIIAGDCRMGAAQGEFEQALGDGAAAVLLGSNGIVASIESSYCISDEFTDVWRAKADSFLRSGEDRFIITEGYNRNMTEAISGLLKNSKLTAKDFAKAAYYGPDPRNHQALARSLGLAPAQVQDMLFDSVGNTGVAQALTVLVAALEQAKPGDRILFAGYGDGADAFVLKVTDAIGKATGRRGVKGHLAPKRMLPSYDKYVSWRQLLPVEAARRPEVLTPMLPPRWRQRKEILSLYGSKCKNCGTPQYPKQRVCVVCQAKDNYEDYPFYDKKAKIFTFTQDRLAVSLDPPITFCVIDFEGGGRTFFEMTDRNPDEVKVGMPVEMTFRNLYEAKGVQNYFWKVRPVR